MRHRHGHPADVRHPTRAVELTKHDMFYLQLEEDVGIAIKPIAEARGRQRPWYRFSVR